LSHRRVQPGYYNKLSNVCKEVIVKKIFRYFAILWENMLFSWKVCVIILKNWVSPKQGGFCMAGVMNFRSALGGFNRQDVVQYIEYMNNKHNSQIEQLNTQLQTAREALAEAQKHNTKELEAQLEAANQRCAELEAQLESNGLAAPVAGDELEAYRRAERAERMAQDRATQIYNQANAALADATVKVEAISDNMSAIAQQISAQLEDSKQQLQDAVAAMYAIRPEEE
jgi:hypothetical protein